MREIFQLKAHTSSTTDIKPNKKKHKGLWFVRAHGCLVVEAQCSELCQLRSVALDTISCEFSLSSIPFQWILCVEICRQITRTIFECTKKIHHTFCNILTLKGLLQANIYNTWRYLLHNRPSQHSRGPLRHTQTQSTLPRTPQTNTDPVNTPVDPSNIYRPSQHSRGPLKHI